MSKQSVKLLETNQEKLQFLLGACIILMIIYSYFKAAYEIIMFIIGLFS